LLDSKVSRHFGATLETVSDFLLLMIERGDLELVKKEVKLVCLNGIRVVD
jgi:hypothetical protein